MLKSLFPVSRLCSASSARPCNLAGVSFVENRKDRTHVCPAALCWAHHLYRLGCSLWPGLSGRPPESVPAPRFAFLAVCGLEGVARLPGPLYPCG